ncbi:MAG: hypothetical protein FJ313_08685, partial [Gemmatimonadetes bacterium]|nr:hypothetical protein [Gemmatimonadota bacterium]
MSLEHAIDLSSIPAGAGRSPDLEAKRRRAWARLSDGERVHVVRVYGRPVAERAMPFAEAGGAYERVLYLLVATRAALTPAEVAYLQIARWYRNTDVATVRARLARMVEAGEARVREDGRFYATPRGLLALGEIEERWLARREGGLG